MIPTKPGWYRARWYPPLKKWCCVEVEAEANGYLVVWADSARDYVSLYSVAEWGERVDMPDDKDGWPK